MMELWNSRRERSFTPCDKYRTFPGWITSSHTFHRHSGEPISWATAGSRTIQDQVNSTHEAGLCPEIEKQRAQMVKQWEGKEQEIMVRREDLRNQCQPASTLHRPEKGGDGLRSTSYAELEEWARWRYHHSLPRRRRLQGEMWSEIQNDLKNEWISSSVGRSVKGEPSTVPSSKNKFMLNHNLTSHQTYPYKEGKAQSFSWNRPPDYTPPPPYSSRPDSNMPTRIQSPPRSPNLSKEHRLGRRSQSERQTEHISTKFLERKARTTTLPGPDRTQYVQEIWSSTPKQVQKQQQIFIPQSSGHHVEEKYQTSYSDTPKNRRESGGTVFCLVSHTGELAASNSNPPFKSSIFTETQEQVQVADKADSRSLLNSFSLDPTPEEVKEEHQNQSNQTVRISHHKVELKKEREEPREQSNEKRLVIDLSKKKHDANFDKNMDNVTPAASSTSTGSVETHQKTTLKFPLWKEPKSHHGSKGVPKKNRSVSREVQNEQSEPRNNITTDENSSLVVIDATCMVIKLEFILPPEREHVHVSSDSNHHHKTTYQTTDSRSEHKFINQERQTSGQVQPQQKNLKERAERVMGNVLQNFFNEALTPEETTQMEESSNHQLHTTLEGSAETELEHCLKVECEKAEILKASALYKEAETPGPIPAAEAMLDISNVTLIDAMFMLEEKIPTAVMDIKEYQVKNSSDAYPSGEHEDSQTLQQTILQPERREDVVLHETEKRLDLNQMFGGGAVEYTNQTFSQEDTPIQWSSSAVRGDHVGDISHLLEEAGDLQNPGSVLPKSYESKHWTKEEKQSNTLHNMHMTSDMFGLKEGQHQEHLLNPQNFCSNLLSTSEKLHQETDQNLSYSADESCAHKGGHFSDVCPNLLQGSVLKIRDSIFHEDIQGENRLSHAKLDVNIHSQSLYGNNMETWRESPDHEDAHCEGNISGDVTYLHSSCSVKDISKPCDEVSNFNEDRVELLSSVLQGEDVHEGVYCLCENNSIERINIMIFSSDTSGNNEEAPESFQDETNLAKDFLLDDLQKISSVQVGGSVANDEDNEGVTSPSPGRHMLSVENLISSLSFTPHSLISPYPPDGVFTTCPSLLPSHSRSSENLFEIISDRAQVCSSVASAKEHIIEKQRPQSLWDIVSRIRKHTAPDSETEEEDGEFWESAENTEDSFCNLSENAKIKKEDSSGLELSKEKCKIMERETHLGDDDDDSVSSSSQDTVIEGEDQRKFL